MSLFCLLWVPLFYLFRRSITGAGGSGGVWALLLGSVHAVFQFSLGYAVHPGGFGFSRWVFAFVDIVSLPVLIPLLVYAACVLLKLFSGGFDFTGFALLWMIPVSALRAISWSSQSDPLLLVVSPLLWTALAVGIPFFISCMLAHFRMFVLVPAILGILALPVAAAASWWALFSQRTVLGAMLFFVSLAPMLVSVTLDFIKAKD
jgi:formate hydrogenlyase subunit 4